jgi:hypothetical protein
LVPCEGSSWPPGGPAADALSQDASFYVVADYRLRHGSLPLGWVALLAQPGWVPAIVLTGLIIFLFPGGGSTNPLGQHPAHHGIP